MSAEISLRVRYDRTYDRTSIRKNSVKKHHVKHRQDDEFGIGESGGDEDQEGT